MAVQEARIEELFDEKNSRLSLSFFLGRLLHEFRNQDISDALKEPSMRTPIQDRADISPDQTTPQRKAGHERNKPS